MFFRPAGPARFCDQRTGLSFLSIPANSSQGARSAHGRPRQTVDASWPPTSRSALTTLRHFPRRPWLVLYTKRELWKRREGEESHFISRGKRGPVESSVARDWGWVDSEDERGRAEQDAQSVVYAILLVIGYPTMSAASVTLSPCNRRWRWGRRPIRALLRFTSV